MSDHAERQDLIEDAGGKSARLPWSTPRVIVATVADHTLLKTTIVRGFDYHYPTSSVVS